MSGIRPNAVEKYNWIYFLDIYWPKEVGSEYVYHAPAIYMKLVTNINAIAYYM